MLVRPSSDKLFHERALGIAVGTMRLPMKKLTAAKKVKTKGQRRGMTYAAA